MGILSRGLYQQGPDRWEYRLTGIGRDLYPLIVELNRWGDRRLAGDHGPPLTTYHRPCGHRLEARIACDQCGELVDAFNVTPPMQVGSSRVRLSAGRAGPTPAPTAATPTSDWR